MTSAQAEASSSRPLAGLGPPCCGRGSLGALCTGSQPSPKQPSVSTEPALSPLGQPGSTIAKSPFSKTAPSGPALGHLLQPLRVLTSPTSPRRPWSRREPLDPRAWWEMGGGLEGRGQAIPPRVRPSSPKVGGRGVLLLLLLLLSLIPQLTRMSCFFKHSHYARYQTKLLTHISSFYPPGTPVCGRFSYFSHFTEEKWRIREGMSLAQGNTACEPKSPDSSTQIIHHLVVHKNTYKIRPDKLVRSRWEEES